MQLISDPLSTQRPKPQSSVLTLSRKKPFVDNGGIRCRRLMAVLPKEVDLFAVGGVNDGNIKDWLEIGVKGVGRHRAPQRPVTSSTPE